LEALQIEADTGRPDLGYHYDLLHWVASGRTVTNATLLLTNGVVVGTYGSLSTYGLRIAPSGKLISESSPTNMNRLVRYNAVQEQASTNWSSSTVAPLISVTSAATPKPEAHFRFTAWAIPGGNGDHVYASVSGASEITTPLEFRDCQFGPGSITAQRVATALTNCLCERLALTLEDANKRPPRSLYNNLFWRGSLQVEVNDDQTWRVYDNLFDQTSIAGTFDYAINHGYNGYVTNFDRLPPNQTNDVVLSPTNLDYQVGPLGRYYYPTNGGLLSRLINAGSRNAANAGLYHYTTTTNKEAATTVDIGFHWIAVSNSLPIDTDGEGLWDAFEDRNGNGVWDAGEFNWQNADTDTNGLPDLQQYEVSNNVLVNDLAQDQNTDQNTQNETAVLAFGNTIIAAWVDSNKNVPGLGLADDNCGPPHWYTTNVPDNVGWAVSRDGGLTFTDKGGLPLLSNVCLKVPTNSSGDGFFMTDTTFGLGQDPMLARDDFSGRIYLLANPRRPSLYYPNGTNQPGQHFVPLWYSTNNGETFVGPTNVAQALQSSTATNANEFADGPFITVDNFAGAGQGTVYATFRMGRSVNTFFCRAGPGGLDWTNTARFDFNGGVPLVAPNHAVYLFHKPSQGAHVFYVSTNRGTNFTGPIQTDFDFTAAEFPLPRSLGASSDDYFLAYIDSTFAINPVNSHFYVIYVNPPSGTNRPNIYFRQSTSGGTNWDAAIQVNVEPGGVATDQWQPALTVKPDGGKLFVGWYDRREDPTNHSLIRMYAAFANLPITDANAFATNFAISTVTFPPVFTGTNTNSGAYDPAYPPNLGELSLDCVPGWFRGTYAKYIGDYDRAFSDSNYVYYTWTDGRIQLTSPNGPTRHQADVRLVRISWPK
jgi:hypothetical protein